MKNLTLEKPNARAEGLRAPGRRRFLDILLGTGVCATLGAVFYPVFKFMTPPQVVEAAQNSVVAAKVTELTDLVRLPQRPVRPDGQERRRAAAAPARRVHSESSGG
jgi:hypothetical protein